MFLATPGVVDVNFKQQTANYTPSTECVCFAGLEKGQPPWIRLFATVQYRFNINHCRLPYMENTSISWIPVCRVNRSTDIRVYAVFTIIN
jgi:hypothetical protein